jgi:hypothetical protein
MFEVPKASHCAAPKTKTLLEASEVPDVLGRNDSDGK